MYLVLTFFFFNDTATTEIYTLSLHDALPISVGLRAPHADEAEVAVHRPLLLVDARAQERPGALLGAALAARVDRKSTRLNSSHANISYAVFCLKKKKTNVTATQ